MEGLQLSLSEPDMIKKRFIAGAVCPSCGELDSIQMFTDENGTQTKQCVECEYSEMLSSEPRLEGELPDARISREEKVLEENVDIVRIVVPPDANPDIS